MMFSIFILLVGYKFPGPEEAGIYMRAPAREIGSPRAKATTTAIWRHARP